MVDDPKFETRAELEKWARDEITMNSFLSVNLLKAIYRIKRVTLKHVHLK